MVFPHRRVSKPTVSRCRWDEQHEGQSRKCCKSVKIKVGRKIRRAAESKLPKSASTAEDNCASAMG